MSEPFHAIIAGAGVGGLTAALALSQAGARVTLLERAPALDEIGAGLQLSPNASRILQGLGVLNALLPYALAPEALRVRRGRDGADLLRMPLGAVADVRWGARHLVAHRADLQRVLAAQCAADPNITLRTGVEALGFAVIPGGVQVGARATDAGEERIRIDGDILIGADGLRSAIRAQLGLGAADRPVYSGRTAWRALIPGAEAPASALRLETNLWLGPRAHLVHYPLRGGALVNLVAIVEDDWRGEATPDIWRQSGEPDTARLRAGFAGWRSEARDLIREARGWRRWPLFERRVAPRWSLDHVVLLGDAAHPVMPFLAQGAALAIEDAESLARAVVAHGRDVARVIAAYERERMPRAADVASASRRQGAIYHMSGPAAFARDMVMRRLSPDSMMARMDWLYGWGQGKTERRSPI